MPSSLYPPSRINAALVIDGGPRIDFQFMPEDIPDDYGAIWQDTTILGRSEPIEAYIAGGPRSFNLRLTFHAIEELKKDVMDKVQLLRSLPYPIYTAVVLPPPTCALVIGTWLNTKVICRSVNVLYQGPWDVETHIPYRVEVALVFTEINQTPKSTADVRSTMGM